YEKLAVRSQHYKFSIGIKTECANITAGAISHLLRELQKEVLREAERLCALDEIWPTVQIRLCQFHAIQAICRWDTDKTKRSDTANPNVSRVEKILISAAFREAQRCRDPNTWPNFRDDFEKTNWWTSSWLSVATDIGLKDGQTRDNANTNNTIERAFKTFDDVFLSCKVNKRIDRLVHILATDWLPFYEKYSSNAPRVSSDIKEMMLRAHELWESGTAITADAKNADLFKVWDTFESKENNAKKKTVQLTVDVSAKGLFCSCFKWQQTGKMCQHMHAVHMWKKMGPVGEYLSKVDKLVADEPAESQMKIENSPGRPRATEPMHASRSGRSAASGGTVHFEKKKGRRKLDNAE
ncbi:hypothetical protein OC842_006964, partial [Tilletia horrida]